VVDPALCVLRKKILFCGFPFKHLFADFVVVVVVVVFKLVVFNVVVRFIVVSFGKLFSGKDRTNNRVFPWSVSTKSPVNLNN